MAFHEILVRLNNIVRASLGFGGSGASGSAEVPVFGLAYTDATGNPINHVSLNQPLPTQNRAIAAQLTRGTLSTVGGTVGPFTMGDTYKSFCLQLWINGGIVANVNYVDVQWEQRNSVDDPWMPVGSVERIDTTVAGDKFLNLAQAFNYWQMQLRYIERNGSGTAPTLNYSIRLTDC